MPIGVLAEKAGVSPRTVTRYFNGERQMTLGSVRAFAAALGLDLHTLLRRAEERERDD
jgi:transcriptional regulator with XRE-family HTH domain